MLRADHVEGAVENTLQQREHALDRVGVDPVAGELVVAVFGVS